MGGNLANRQLVGVSIVPSVLATFPTGGFADFFRLRWLASRFEQLLHLIGSILKYAGLFNGRLQVRHSLNILSLHFMQYFLFSTRSFVGFIHQQQFLSFGISRPAPGDLPSSEFEPESSLISAQGCDQLLALGRRPKS